jgi:hypothetical protein
VSGRRAAESSETAIPSRWIDPPLGFRRAPIIETRVVFPFDAGHRVRRTAVDAKILDVILTSSLGVSPYTRRHGEGRVPV